MSRRGARIAGNSGIPSAAPSFGGALPLGTPGLGLNQVVPGAQVAQGNRISHTSDTWSDAYGGLGLPRPAQDFTHGAFGPYPPILSMPVDEPDPFTGQPQPRAEQYRAGWNLPVGTPGTEGLKLADFQTLQTLANLYSVARACIEYLKREITSLEWDILPTQDAARAMKNSPGELKDFGKRKAEVIKFFRRPDPDYFSWQDWLSVVLEEVLVYDALSLVLQPKWGRGMGKGPLNSDLDCLRVINGPTIRPLYDLHGNTPRPPAVAYQQYLYGVPRVDLGAMLTERDVEMGALRGMEAQAFLGSQLIYRPMVPRRWTPYGFPPVERGLIPVISGLSKQGYQLDFFREGTVPAVYISPGGDLSPNQVRELQDALNAIAGDPAFHHKVIVLPSGSQVLPQRDAQLADQFDEVIMSQTCQAFGVQPMQVGIMPRVSTTTSPGAANQMAKQSSNAQDQSTLQPHTIFISVLIERVISDVFGQEDMRFVFDGMEEEEDQQTLTNLVVNQWSNGMLTTDEARDALGYQPFGLPETSVPLVKTATGVSPLTTSVQLAQTQADQAQQPPEPAAAADPNLEGGNAGQDPGNNAGSPDEDKLGPDKPPSKPTTKPKPSPGDTNGDAGRDSARDSDTTTAMSEGTDGAADDGTGASDVGKVLERIRDPWVTERRGDRLITKASATPALAPTAAATGTQPIQPDAAQQDAQAAVEALASAYIIKQLMGTFLNLYAGTTTVLQAFNAALMAIAEGYARVYTAAGKAAIGAGHAAKGLTEDAIQGLAARRATTQQPYLLGLAQAVKTASTGGQDLAWLAPRVKLYGEGLHGAYQEGYGRAVQVAGNGDYTIIWRLGDTEHCPLCLARDGRAFTFDDLPGWPGDGGFGGPLCLGGPNCGCSLEYRENDHVLSIGQNAQRPGSIAYFAQQNQDIQALRQKIHEARLASIAALPNEVGNDGTSVQSRAIARYQLQQQLAHYANQRIQATGGYGGVTVEPTDIPAKLIASLLPLGTLTAQDVPLTDVMDAIDQMFAAKFAAADLTKTAFEQVILGAVAELTEDERKRAAELDACARHLLKGRDPLSWECVKTGVLDVKQLSDDLSHGFTRAQAVQAALRRRRYVTLDGQVIEPQPTQADAQTAAIPLSENGGHAQGPASGSGGAYPVPHDANGIFHDVHDLSDPRPRPRAISKSADDPGDPNPVEAEHVINQMRKNYPEKALGWMQRARWVGPVDIPTDRVDTDAEASWAASHEGARVKEFAKGIKRGTGHTQPIVAVQEPGDDKVKVIDGHHRFLAYRKLGRPARMYVGFVNHDGGPWDETHSFQVHQGADPANKALVKVGPRGYEHGWIFVGTGGGSIHRDLSDHELGQLSHAPVTDHDDTYRAVKPAQGLDLSDDERAAIKDYTDGGMATRVNHHLRTGEVMNPAFAADAQQTITHLKSAFDKASPLEKPITTYRGVHHASRMFGEVGSRVGDRFIDNGFASTSSSPRAADWFTRLSREDTALVTVHAPAGTHVVSPDQLSRYGDVARELILPAGSSYRVISDRVVPGDALDYGGIDADSYVPANVRHVQLEMVPGE